MANTQSATNNQRQTSFSRFLALLLEIPVLGVLIHISVNEHRTSVVKLFGVVLAILVNAIQLYALPPTLPAKSNNPLHFFPSPWSVLWDMVIMVLMGASILYDWIDSWSRFEDGHPVQYTTLFTAQFYLVYAVLATHGFLIFASVYRIYGLYVARQEEHQGAHVEQPVRMDNLV
ncbi:uncharacterized protein B0H64DRAFT_430529 [Chaetomium fimeti]|uniref:Uncharacterized protein n=1 Tax=Chaetomium fimeti TaxID=1854472 RepID=A0AAE0LVX5_9PEZI|nr:hypothetical protein B0H64DRAFT_430529 [Chaetomium fimeti]